MKLDTPLIVVIAAVAFFYAKLVFFQWRIAKAEAKKTNLQIAQARKKGKTPQIAPKPTGFFAMRVTSWPLAVPMLLLTLVGFVMPTMTFLPAAITSYWYIVTAVGIVGFSFSVK